MRQLTISKKITVFRDKNARFLEKANQSKIKESKTKAGTVTQEVECLLKKAEDLI